MLFHVDSVSSDAFVASASDGTRLTLPLTAVYGTPTVGKDVRVIAVAPSAEDLPRTVLAQTLLNELLSPPSA